MTYVTLIAADIYRDGGSLEARFRCDDGSFESVWLQAKPENRSFERFVHADLRVASSADGAQAGRTLSKGSQEEGAVVAKLRSFMLTPEVDVPFSHRAPVDYYLERVRALISAIPHRQGETNA